MIFSNKRRTLLAKTLMDLAKVQGAAGFATFFFASMSLRGRWLMAGLFVGLLVCGFLLQPPTDDDEDNKE